MQTTANCHKEKQQLIDNHLHELLKGDSKLLQAARYALFSGGKRLRPLLALLTNEALGGDTQKCLTPAICLEMIHTYSLVHDDLPAMDDDETRRGKPTLHKVFPESHAILAGDFLLTYPFELLATAPNINDKERLLLISTLAKAAGSHGMIGGQIMDIEAAGKKTPMQELKTIHQMKTATLIQASLLFGAITAGATEEKKRELVQFGKALGLAYQIKDDILDVTSMKKKAGMSSDEVNQKSTYVSHFGLLGAKQELKKQYDRTQTIDIKPLREFAADLLNRSL